MRRIDPRLITCFIIAVLCGISLLLRTLLPFEQVFSGEWVKFTSIDAYYHMRIIDNLAHNFPGFTHFDPYLIYPGGTVYGGVHFFDWLIGGFAWLFGLGSPTERTVNIVGAYAPAVMAALTVIPVYFIGKSLFNRKLAGFIAAGLIAVLPGEYIGRSLLGFTDHHVAETLFSTTTVMFLILAIQEASRRKLTFSHVMNFDRKVVIRPLVYSLLAGLFLGIYLITWLGAMLFVFIFVLYILGQFIINHLKHIDSEHLVIVSFVTFLIAFVIFIWVASPFRFMIVSSIIALFAAPVLYGISRLITRLKWHTIFYPVVLVGLGVICIFLFRAVDPDAFQSITSQFGIFQTSGASAATTLEMQPFLKPRGEATTLIAWGNYTTSMFLIDPSLQVHEQSWIASLKWYPGFAFLPIYIWVLLCIKLGKKFLNKLSVMVPTAVVLLGLTIWLWFASPAEWKVWFPGIAAVGLLYLINVYTRYRNGEQHLLLFFVWTIIMLLAMLSQRRFAYYFVVNIALLTAFISSWFIYRVGLGKLEKKAEAVEARPAEKKKAKKEKVYNRETGITIYHLNTALAVIVVLLFVFTFNIIAAKKLAEAPQFGPSDAWQESMVWLKNNTPEPFGDDAAYYATYEAPVKGETFDYPDTVYAVTSWWDYGYWITRIGHRIPNTNPSQAAGPIKKVAGLLLSEDEAEVRDIMNELNSSYLVADNMMSLNKFWAIVTWSGRPQNDFTESFRVEIEGKEQWVNVWYPAYYRTTLARLYNFDGQEVNSVMPVVLTYIEKYDREGYPYKEITAYREFDDYNTAQTFIDTQESGNHVIVGIHPYISPVPLQQMDDFELIFAATPAEPEQTPEVKIFEFTR